MAAACQKKTEAQLQEDMLAIKTYLHRAQDHANRQAVSLKFEDWLWITPLIPFIWSSNVFQPHVQGALDIKHLKQRYEKGKAWVTSFFQTHHRYVEMTGGLSDCHAALGNIQAQFQSEEDRSPNPLRGCTHSDNRYRKRYSETILKHYLSEP